MTWSCLFTLRPNLFSPICGIHTDLPGIFHELIWSGNVGRTATDMLRGFFLMLLFFLLILVLPPTSPSTHCQWPEGNSASSESICECFHKPPWTFLLKGLYQIGDLIHLEITEVIYALQQLMFLPSAEAGWILSLGGQAGEVAPDVSFSGGGSNIQHWWCSLPLP